MVCEMERGLYENVCCDVQSGGMSSVVGYTESTDGSDSANE